MASDWAASAIEKIKKNNMSMKNYMSSEATKL